MTNTLKHPVRPGGLSKADHEMIFMLAGKRWSSSRIAATIEKHPSTVQWFMYRHGLKAPNRRESPKPYMRNGRAVMPFSTEEDAFIEALRVQDYAFAKIADLATKRFGHQRSGHTIHNRLVMLAAREVA